MHRRHRNQLSLGILLSTLCVTPAALAAEKDLLFGSVAMDIPAVMHKRLTPLTHYLSTQLGRPVALQLSPNMGAAIDEVAQERVDLAYLTPVAYLQAHEKGGARLVAKTISGGKGAFKLMIVVKADSPIRKVADLAGKRFALGDKGAILQRAVVVGAGMPLEKLADYTFIGHYDNIARAVANGDFDAGILKDSTAAQWEGKGLRVLYSSADLPPYNIAARGHIDDALLAKIQGAFLRLDPNKPEHLAIIKALDETYDGFAATSDAEYEVVRTLIKPFANGG